VDLSELVLRDGTVTRAQGRVVAHEGKTWFEPTERFGPAIEAPRPSGYGVAVLGVDVDTLTRRVEADDGTVEGHATLAGIWAEDALVVSHQAAPGLLPEHQQDRPARPDHPWSHDQAEAAYDELNAHMRDWSAYEIGQTESWDGLLTLSVKVVRVLPGLIEWARPLPDGMLALDVWLAPHPHAL
jgi:hypothetical protein